MERVREGRGEEEKKEGQGLLYRVVVCYTESSLVIPSRRVLYRVVVCYTVSSFVIPGRRLLYRVVVVMCICPSPLEVKLRLECVRCFFLRRRIIFVIVGVTSVRRWITVTVSAERTGVAPIGKSHGAIGAAETPPITFSTRSTLLFKCVAFVTTAGVIAGKSYWWRLRVSSVFFASVHPAPWYVH